MIADINGCQIAYDVRGDGDALLLLHGGMGAGADWKYVFPADPPGYRVIVPDLRGHGASTNPSGAFTFRQAALDILELLDRLGIETVKAIGLSGGGITLLHMATLQPQRIAAMIVVSAPPYFPAQARAIQASSPKRCCPRTSGRRCAAAMSTAKIRSAASSSRPAASRRTSTTSTSRRRSCRRSPPTR
jgi:pimeloyl-ACP methyl ester carboxylesterase